MMNNLISSLRLPNQIAYIPPALAYVEALAATAGFDSPTGRQIALALEEALSNVVKHGLVPDEQTQFDLICEENAADLIFTIREQGRPFDPTRVAVYRPDAASDGESTAGLGMFLIKKSMDEVTFRNLGRAGKELRLVKHKRNARIDALAQKPPAATATDTTGTAKSDGAPPQTIRLRQLRPEEALEISRCAWQAYGYSYEDYIYYPERIAAMNRDGAMSSLVATTETGDEIAGHLALKRSPASDRIAEIGVGFVKPAFRGRGILKTMTAALIDRAREQGLAGIYCRPVTSHVISQKTVDGFGFRACGVLLGQFPGDVDFKKLTGKVTHKEHGLLMFLDLRDDAAPRRVFFPPRHRAMLATIYQWLNLPYIEAAPAAPALPEIDETELDDDCVDVLNIAEIRIMRYGADLLPALRAALRRHCMEQRDAIYLYMDLAADATAETAAECETLGFRFAGVLPYALRGHDAMILQFLNNLRVDFNALKPFAPAALQLLEYIRQHQQDE